MEAPVVPLSDIPGLVKSTPWDQVTRCFGMKACLLAKASNCGLPIPQGFVITKPGCAASLKLESATLCVSLFERISSAIKKLETATKPTTATIYKIHFGCDKNYAKVLKPDGNIIEYEDIAELKNEQLGDALIVDVFDTSKKVPTTTILVDTPGLSSSDPRHKQALINFLPQADGILLVTDVNQQLTRSLTDFANTIDLSKRPIFLVITKCDTKSGQELEQVKKYINDNTKLPIQQIVCVSAIKGNLQELFTLFDKIQTEKDHIIKLVDGERVKNVVITLLQRIDELLQSSVSDKDLKNAIRQQELDLKQMYRNIDSLTSDVATEVKECGRQLARQFEDIVSGKLETLVAGKSDNFDADAVSVINNTSSLLLNEYKNNIQAIFRKKAKERCGKENAVSLLFLENIDLSSMSINGLNYNINLNALGHQYDNTIATVTKVAAAAGVCRCFGFRCWRSHVGSCYS